jgi:heparan-alpha-glucosaminide N-acetyltransferase
MNASTSPAAVSPDVTAAPKTVTARVSSIDAIRGLVVFTMIFVNDLAGASNSIVPPWMKHFHGRSGMTFVDLVFPAFLFIVGMSLPLALGSRLRGGDPLWKVLAHVVLRTLSLLFIGVLMVNETPDSAKMGWSGTLWSVLMYLSAILAFCTMAPHGNGDLPTRRERLCETVFTSLRVLGFASLVWLALVFRGQDGHQVISFSPFSIHHQWYGILGLIGWAYLVGAMVFLIFGPNPTALLACMVLLMCLYPADRTGAFSNFWLAKHVGFGGTLGSQAAITVGGLLLASVLTLPGSTLRSRSRFTLRFIAATSAGALLLNGLYGINKNQATPSWCLWACAITAAAWLILHILGDGREARVSLKPLAVAGQNVFLAYLISEMLPSTIQLVQLGDWYSDLATPHLFNALARSAGCALLVLGATAGLNSLGFRLKL